MLVPSVKPDLHKVRKLTACGDMQRFEQEEPRKWCAEKRKTGRPKQHIKERFMGRGLLLERR